MLTFDYQTVIVLLDFLYNTRGLVSAAAAAFLFSKVVSLPLFIFYT